MLSSIHSTRGSSVLVFLELLLSTTGILIAVTCASFHVPELVSTKHFQSASEMN